jgi:hypothetical protein
MRHGTIIRCAVSNGVAARAEAGGFFIAFFIAGRSGAGDLARFPTALLAPTSAAVAGAAARAADCFFAGGLVIVPLGDGTICGARPCERGQTHLEPRICRSPSVTRVRGQPGRWLSHLPPNLVSSTTTVGDPIHGGLRETGFRFFGQIPHPPGGISAYAVLDWGGWRLLGVRAFAAL